MTTMTETTNETTGLATDKAAVQATILKRSVCLVLHCSFIGNERKVPLADLALKEERRTADGVVEEDVKTSKDELRLSKQLLDRKDLSKVKGVLDGAKGYLRSIATQGHRVFGAGTYLVPLTAVLEVEQRLAQFQADLRAAVDELVEKYPAMVEKRREALKELFDAKDYLSPLELRAEFGLDWSYTSFAAPEQLETVDRAVVEAVQRKKEAEWAAAYEEVIVQLRASALTVMKELVNRLKPGADGKPKALYGTALRDLDEFVRTLPKRNTGDDTELEDALKAVVAYSEGVDVESLRKIPALRQGLQEHAEAAVAALEGLVQNTRRRGISFGGGF